MIVEHKFYTEYSRWINENQMQMKVWTLKSIISRNMVSTLAGMFSFLGNFEHG
jgi:hypothetical protein